MDINDRFSIELDAEGDVRYEDMDVTFSCFTCGALVKGANAELHNAWHDDTALDVGGRL